MPGMSSPSMRTATNLSNTITIALTKRVKGAVGTSCLRLHKNQQSFFNTRTRTRTRTSTNRSTIQSNPRSSSRSSIRLVTILPALLVLTRHHQYQPTAVFHCAVALSPSSSSSSPSSSSSSLHNQLASASTSLSFSFSGATMDSSSNISSITNLQQLTSCEADHLGGNMSASSSTTTTTTQSLILSKTIPTLSSKSHKGSSGRITILGGSAKYTGAPYYAAMGALRTGSDLVTVYCANEATGPIKSYSPELMVEGVYSASEFDKLALGAGTSAGAGAGAGGAVVDEEVNQMVQKVVQTLGRMHSLIIGPGLGRCPLVLKATSMIIQHAMEINLNVILDADGLYLLSLEENRDLFLNGLSSGTSRSRVVLTPNVVEYKRLVDTMGEGSEDILRTRLPGVTVVRKGHEDIIEYVPRGGQEHTGSNKNNIQSRMVCTEKGGLKRSGGLGDILAGSIGTFVAWNSILENQSNKVESCEDATNKNNSNDDINLIQDDLVLGCWMACCLTKQSTFRAFQKRKRSMTAPDVLEEIGNVMDEVASSTIEY